MRFPIEVLQRVDEHQVWRRKGFGSLHVYVVEALGLSDDQAYHFTRLARKATEIPELKQAIDQGVVKLSQARRILKVLTPETKTEWIEKAATIKQRELEREVARVHPQAAVPERIKPLSRDLSELRCSLPKARFCLKTESLRQCPPPGAPSGQGAVYLSRLWQ